MHRIFALLILSLLAILSGCGTRTSMTFRNSGKPKVVATFSVIGDFVTQIAGDKVELVTLVGPDGDAHTFEPTPQDLTKISNAGLILENGAHFETWLDKMVQSSGTKARRVVTSEGITLLKLGDEPDPHLWHSVDNALVIVRNVANALVEFDPANAEYYKANLANYIAKLTELDGWVKTEVAKLPVAERKLVTSHDTFGYFAKSYGFKVTGSVLPVSTAAEDPSVAEFAKLVAQVKAEKVRAVFCEASHNAKLIDRLAKDAGVKVAPPLFTDALGPTESDGGTYIGMMKHNVTIIVMALKP